MGETATADFKAKEKVVLAHLLTIPEVAEAVALQRAGRSQDAKAAIRAAVPHFPREIVERANAARPGGISTEDAARVPVGS
mmetsp:Transcript_59321/g.190864  ORF Transcript_59321/g.190864 Transcript_59321/m.190864 type:complete len:81 (-) Transcript_59321:341-583(-)